MKDKNRKNTFIHSLLWSKNVWLFTLLTLLLLLLPLLHIFYSDSSSRPLALLMTLLLIVGWIWYVLRTIIGLVFWFKYLFTKKSQEKKNLKQKIKWGLDGIWLFVIVFIFYFILTIILTLLGYSNGPMYSRFSQ